MSNSGLGTGGVRNRSNLGLAGRGDRAEGMSEAELEILQGAVIEEFTIPGSAVAGETINISGVLGYDDTPGFSAELRIVLEASNLSEPRTEEFDMTAGETEPFSFSIPAPQNPGTSVTVRLKGQVGAFLGGWNTDDTVGPETINIVSPGQKSRERVLDVAPWVLGGATVGTGVGLAADEIGPVPGAAIGAGAGLSSFLITDRELLPQFSFPTTEVVATSLLLGTGAILLSQVGGVDLGSPGRAVRRRLPGQSTSSPSTTS